MYPYFLKIKALLDIQYPTFLKFPVLKISVPQLSRPRFSKHTLPWWWWWWW